MCQLYSHTTRPKCCHSFHTVLAVLFCGHKFQTEVIFMPDHTFTPDYYTNVMPSGMLNYLIEAGTCSV